MNKNRRDNFKNEEGQIMLIMVVFFLAISLFVVLGLSYTVAKDTRMIKNNLLSKQSYYASESGVEDVLYRLKNGKTHSSSETLLLDDIQAVTTVSDSGSGIKTIHAEAVNADLVKKIEAKVFAGDGTAFNYGIQTGNGGFTITGGSSVIGNVYSNGSILGGSGVHISGSAVAASGGPGIAKDEANETPIETIPYSITFNKSRTILSLAQSFQPASTSAVSKISLYLKKTGSPGDFEAKIMTNNAGSPGTELAEATLYNANVTTNYGWVDIVFSTTPTLVKDTTYWLVIVGTTNKDTTNNYIVAANNTYARGQAKTGSSGNDWSNTVPTGLDAYFRLYLGSKPSEIKGYEGDYLYVGTTADDFAWAPSIDFISSTGKIYCQTATRIDGNKTCDTSRSNPSVMPMPISEANIDNWKAEATSGGTITGDYHVNWAGAILGPKIITGNLLIDGGGTLTLTGTVWVKGYITVTGGGKVKLAASYGRDSGVILTDKYAALSGNGQFSGSGTAGSYPIILSTSVCPDTTPCSENNSAISLTGGSGAVVLAAPYGKVNINGGSAVKSVTGDSIYISGGGNVTYESGLADMTFKSGPAGGWNITSWQEVE